MRTVARTGCAVVLLHLLGSTAQATGEFNFLPDHTGRFSAPVASHQQLNKKDAAAFKRNLERLRDLLAVQPVFNPARGVEVVGYLRPNDEQPKLSSVPIPGFGYLRFHFYHQSKRSGKPVRICCTTDEIYLSVNDPSQGLDAVSVPGSATKVFYEPQRGAVLNGYPVYRMENGDELIVLNRSVAAPWVPFTRAEYIAAGLEYWRKMAEANPLDTLSPEAVKRHQAALDEMSGEERTMPARQFRWDPLEPTLAPVGSTEGQPLVKANPAWFNPALPRTAFQLIVCRFRYTGNLNHDAPGPTEYGDITPYRVWQALHDSNWAEIGGALTDN